MSFTAGQKLDANVAKEALEYYLKLKESGDVSALMYLGAIYEFGGDGVVPDYDKAREFYDESINSDGAVESYYGLARMCYSGKGEPVNYQYAFTLYKHVYREYDDCFAPYILGKMCFNGLGVAEDLDEAEQYFKTSINRGHIYAITELSRLYFRQGKYIKSILLKLKAGMRAFVCSNKPERSPCFRVE